MEKTIHFFSELEVTVNEVPGSDTFAILLHGLCVDRNEYHYFYRSLADELAKNGISSARFDFAGHGIRKEEIDHFSIAGQFSEACELIKMIIKEYPSVRRIVPVGTSFGAPIAVFAGCRFSYLCDRIALLSPVLDYRATFLEPFAEWGIDNFGRENIDRSIDVKYLYIDDKFPMPSLIFSEMELVNPLDFVARFGGEILIVHGEKDSMVPIGPARLASTVGRNVTLVEPHGMDHGPIAVGDEDGLSSASQDLSQQVVSLIVEFCGARKGMKFDG